MNASFSPLFTMAERDRRWSRVREMMAADGLDVIIAPPHTGHHDHFSAYTRYLTGLGGYSLEVGAVFPLDGDVTAIVVPDVPIAKWRQQQDWVNDIRSHGRAFGAGIIARLKELGLARPRIGLAGLDSVPRFADGIVAQAFYRKLTEAFPHAVLSDCTGLLDACRYTKGAEEIEFLRGSVLQAEAAIEAMCRTAKPGVTENAVYASMLSAMIERGSEVPAMIMWAAGGQVSPLSSGNPTQRPFAAGDLLRVEVEGRYAGYCGQVTQMAVLGPVPAAYRDAWRVQQDAVELCSSLAKPGVTLGDLAAQTLTVAEGTAFDLRFLMHGRGLGDDAPTFVFSADQAVKDWVLEENASFIIKPVVSGPGVTDLVWGDSVVITEQGAERLGTLKPCILEIG